MRSWEIGAPISEPAGFGQLEVPQVRLVDGRPLLVFTCHPDEQSEQRKRAAGLFSTWCVAGDSPTGPWDVARARPFTREPALFAAPLVRQRDGSWALIGFRNADGTQLEILDPIQVRLQDGALIAR